MSTRALLDTNILIHREARKVIRDDIGALFRWLEELRYERLIHPDLVEEVRRHADPDLVRNLREEARKLQNAKDQGA